VSVLVPDRSVRTKREPGAIPGLPRSGKRERSPHGALVLGTGKQWSQEPGVAGMLAKPEDLPTPGLGRHPRPAT